MHRLCDEMNPMMSNSTSNHYRLRQSATKKNTVSFSLLAVSSSSLYRCFLPSCDNLSLLLTVQGISGYLASHSSTPLGFPFDRFCLVRYSHRSCYNPMPTAFSLIRRSRSSSDKCKQSNTPPWRRVYGRSAPHSLLSSEVQASK